MHRIAVVVSAATLVCSLGGCSASDRNAPAAQQAPDAVAEANRSAVFEMYQGASFRYGQVAVAADLAEVKETELALTGVVQGFEPVRPEDDRTWVVMRVKPLEVFDGEINAEVVRVNILAPSTDSPVPIEKAIPVGTSTVLYLALDEDEKDVYLPLSPQGFIVTDSESAFFPYDPSLPQEQPLNEQVPPGVRVP